MRYSLIRQMDISNGKGIGVSLFLQGCHFHCKGCFNQETWDFNGGKLWDKNIESRFMNLIQRPFITRVSFLGGEPLEKNNLYTLSELIFHIKSHNPSINIWLYTGYTIENLINRILWEPQGLYLRQIIRFADYIVDGQFELDKQDINHKTTPFAGSTNQRIIDINQSMEHQKIILAE